MIACNADLGAPKALEVGRLCWEIREQLYGHADAITFRVRFVPIICCLLSRFHVTSGAETAVLRANG